MLSPEAKFKIKIAAVGAIGLLFLSEPSERAIKAVDSIFPHLKILEDLLPKVGDAFIIAVVLGFLVDLAAKREMLRDFVLEVSSHIIGRHLPPEIREELRDYLNADFVRPSWVLIYRLRELPGNGHALELSSLLTGELQNRSNKTKPFRFAVTIDDTWLQGVGSAQLLRIALKQGSTFLMDRKFSSGNSKDIVKADGQQTFSEDFPLQPYTRSSYTTVLECLEYFPTSYVYPFISAMTVSKMALTIYFDSKKYRIEVSLSSGNDDKVERLDFEGGATWTIDKVLLPGQSVMTNWQPIYSIESSIK